jgi:hypothetical protein
MFAVALVPWPIPQAGREPVLVAWRERRVPLEEYPAGSDGPPPILG